MSAFAERLRDRIEAIDRVSAETSRRAEAYAAMREELGNVTAEASSADGAVTVVAAAGGSISDVRFSGAIHSMQPRDLSRSVLAALGAAQAQAARTQAEVVRSNLGSTAELEQAIVADERFFGVPDGQ
jgi:DNA-binding protein YbaB